MINNIHTLVEFLPLCCALEQLEEEGGAVDEETLIKVSTSSIAVLFESSLLVAANSEKREQWMRVLHGSMKLVVGSPQKFWLRGFLVKIGAVVEWRCGLPLESFCCDIPEANKMSEMCHLVAVKRPVLDLW